MRDFLRIGSVGRSLAAAALAVLSCGAAPQDFLRVKGPDIVDAKGKVFFIRGTNLGNWLNPEGYMFGFHKTTSAHLIDEAFRQMVGPETTDAFWRAFRANYVTEADIRFVAETGSNTIRIPFHYRLFTNDPYLGGRSAQDGFALIDPVVGWCRKHGLRVILDMHCCPGGQTGDNIDDSYGYPWLFTSEREQKLYCEIWKRIAAHYANEPAVLGYDLMNEPISSRLADKDELNRRLEPVQRLVLEAIRTVDRRHIVLFAGAQWNGNFAPLSTTPCDDNLMYTCHRYWTPPDRIGDFVAFRDKVNRPMYMGETGHSTNGWYRAFTQTMEKNNIGWTYWPLKKPTNSSWLVFDLPEGWDAVVKFVDGDRSSYKAIQASRPDQAVARAALMRYAANCRFDASRPDAGYLEAVGLRVPESGVKNREEGSDPNGGVVRRSSAAMSMRSSGSARRFASPAAATPMS